MVASRDPALQDFVRLLRRSLRVASVVAFAAGAAMFLLAIGMNPRYEASSTLFLAARDNPAPTLLGGALTVAGRPDIRAYQIAATSPTLISAALLAAGFDEPTMGDIEKASKQIRVRAEGEDDESSRLLITVANDDPAVAANIANSLAAALLSWDLARANAALTQVIASLTAQVAGLEQIRSSGSANGADIGPLQNRLAERQLELASLQALVGSPIGHLELLTEAVPPFEPASPSPAVMAAIGVLVGFLSVMAIAMIRSSLDDRFRNPQEVSDLLGIPILAELRKRTRRGHLSIQPESVKRLRSEVVSASRDIRPMCVAVVSVSENTASPAVAVELAKSFAQLSSSTLLVDADLRNPVIYNLFGIRGRPPSALNKQLREPGRRTEALAVTDGDSTLYVAPGFRESSSHSELISGSFEALLVRLSSEFDEIIINTTPVLPYAETLTVVEAATGVILLVDTTRDRRQQVVDAVAAIHRARGHVLGLVVGHGDTPSGRVRRPRSDRTGGLREPAQWTVKQLAVPVGVVGGSSTERSDAVLTLANGPGKAARSH